MSYLTFATKQDAERAQRRILKVWSYFLKQEDGYDVGVDDVVNTGFRNGRMVQSVTDRWDVPRELVDGKWAIVAPKLTMAKMKTVPRAARSRFGITKRADILGAAFTTTKAIKIKMI